MWLETAHPKGQVDHVAMDSKADDSDSFEKFGRQRKKKMITRCRTNMDKTTIRNKMINFMKKPKHKKIYRQRSYKVEPM